MVTVLARPGRMLAGRLLLLQACIVMLLALGFCLAVDSLWGLSALIGGGIVILANAVFAFFSFLFVGARAAKKITLLFYTGEVLKILLTVILLSIAYMYIPVALLPLKITYLLVLVVSVFAPALFINNKK